MRMFIMITFSLASASVCLGWHQVQVLEMIGIWNNERATMPSSSHTLLAVMKRRIIIFYSRNSQCRRSLPELIIQKYPLRKLRGKLRLSEKWVAIRTVERETSVELID